MQLQSQKQKQRQKQKQTQLFFRVTPPPQIITKLPKEAAMKKIKKLPLKQKQQLYDVLIKQRGKFTKIFDDLPINKAKKKGAIFTDRNLGATFKIVKDKVSKKPVRDIPMFKVDKTLFRDYRISGGRKVPMKNMWIEKRGARLNTRSEVVQLLRAKRTTPKKKTKRIKRK